MARYVEGMTVPRGERVLELLPSLARALDGSGPALLPVGEGDPRGRAICETLGAGTPLEAAEDDPDDPTSLVMPTSGSTGTPKGVLLSAGQLAASAAATEQRLGGSGHWLLALPAEHIAGMQVLLRAARAGTEPTVYHAEAGFNPADFVIHAQRLPGPRRYVSLVPTQLRRILADPRATAATAEIFNTVLVGGSACPASLLADARAAGISVVTTYGMTETCGGCVYDGVPLPGVSAELNTDGAIVLTGPMVARGYRHQPNHPAFATRGRFATADTGIIGPETDGDGTTLAAATANAGRLTVTGRRDDVIVTGGVNVAPGPIEQALLALPGIAEALVVGAPDPEWGHAVTALIVTEPTLAAAAAEHGASRTSAAEPWSTTRVRAALTGLSPAERPQRVIPVDAIPQLPSGKPDRAAATDLAHRYLASVR